VACLKLASVPELLSGRGENFRNLSSCQVVVPPSGETMAWMDSQAIGFPKIFPKPGSLTFLLES